MLNLRKNAVIADTGIILLFAKVSLPLLLTWLVNLRLRKISGYRGRTRRVSVYFLHPRLVVQDLSLTKSSGSKPEQHLLIKSIVIGSHWRNILAGALVGYIRVDSPRLLLDVASLRRETATSMGSKKVHKPASTACQEQQFWQKKVKEYPVFRLNSVILVGGEVHLKGITGQENTDLRIDRLEFGLENITNVAAPVSTTKAFCTGRVMAAGELRFRAEGYPLAPGSAFNIAFQITNIDLKGVHTIIEKNLGIDLRRGNAALYLEAVAADGQIQGYAKPVFDHLELKSLLHSDLRGRLKTCLIRIALNLGRNRKKDRIATRIDFGGSLEEPTLNISKAVLRFLRNGFIKAERASFDDWHRLPGPAKAPEVAENHYGFRHPAKSRSIIRLFTESFRRWSDDAAPRMAAALSYYTAFSMAPLLIITIAIAGLALGRDAAQGKILNKWEDSSERRAPLQFKR